MSAPPIPDESKRARYWFHMQLTISETDTQSDIVAQVTLDSEDIEKVYPDAEGWDHSRLPLVLASKMLPSLNETQRSLKTLVNWGSGPPK